MVNSPTSLTARERKSLLRLTFKGLSREDSWRLVSDMLRGSIEKDNSAQYVIYTDVYDEESVRNNSLA